MCGHEMFFSSFRIFPLIPFLCMAFFIGRRVARRAKRWSLPEKPPQKLSAQRPSGNIPEELQKAGQQIVDNLDWEIRFLEKQCLEVSDAKERQNLEAELRRKREEYHSVRDLLEL